MTVVEGLGGGHHLRDLAHQITYEEISQGNVCDRLSNESPTKSLPAERHKEGVF